MLNRSNICMNWAHYIWYSISGFFRCHFFFISVWPPFFHSPPSHSRPSLLLLPFTRLNHLLFCPFLWSAFDSSVAPLLFRRSCLPAYSTSPPRIFSLSSCPIFSSRFFLLSPFRRQARELIAVLFLLPIFFESEFYFILFYIFMVFFVYAFFGACVFMEWV